MVKGGRRDRHGHQATVKNPPSLAKKLDQDKVKQHPHSPPSTVAFHRDAAAACIRANPNRGSPAPLLFARKPQSLGGPVVVGRLRYRLAKKGGLGKTSD
jgi:hypothetical protein